MFFFGGQGDFIGTEETKVIIKTNMLLAIVSLLSIEGTLLLTWTDSNTVNQWKDRTDRNFS